MHECLYVRMFAVVEMQHVALCACLAVCISLSPPLSISLSLSLSLSVSASLHHGARRPFISSEGDRVIEFDEFFSESFDHNCRA